MNKASIPMALTWLRILIAPAVIVLVLLELPHWNIISAGLFIIASISDWLDGYLARKWHVVSDMGKFLDPIADKVLVSSVLILLIPLQRIDALAVIILLNRDILIGGVRSLAATKGVVIAADQLGKWKTAIQMVAIPLLLVGGYIGEISLIDLGYWGIWLSVALSILSGIQYTVRFFGNSAHS